MENQNVTDPPVNKPAFPGPYKSDYDEDYVGKILDFSKRNLSSKFPQVDEKLFKENLSNPEFVKGLYDEISKTGKAKVPDFETFSKKVMPKTVTTAKIDNPKNAIEFAVKNNQSLLDLPSEEEMIKWRDDMYKQALAQAKERRESQEKEEEVLKNKPYYQEYKPTVTPLKAKLPEEMDDYKMGIVGFAKDAFYKKTSLKDHAITTVNNIAEYALSPTEKIEFGAIKKVEAAMPFYREALSLEEKAKKEQRSLTSEEKLKIESAKKIMSTQLKNYKDLSEKSNSEIDLKIQSLTSERDKVFNHPYYSETEKELKLKEIDKKISEFKGRKEFFLNPEKYASDKVKEYKLSASPFENLSDRQKLTGYMLSKYQESKDILQEFGYPEADIQKLIDPRVNSWNGYEKDSDINPLTELYLHGRNQLRQLVGTEKWMKLQENIEIIQDLAPVALANRNPIIGKTESPEAIFLKAAWNTAVGGDPLQLSVGSRSKIVTATDQERARRLQDAFIFTGADYSSASPDVKEMLDERSKPYESWTPESVAEMIGVTTGIIGPAVTGAGLTKTGLTIASKTPKLGTAAKWVLESDTRMAKILKAGIEYQTGGLIFERQAGELNFGSGVAGEMGSQFIDSLSKRTKLGKFVPGIVKFFGGNSENATLKIVNDYVGRKIGQGTGETAEETMQTLYQMYSETDNGKEFMGQIKQQFGNVSDATFFLAGTFLMGMAMGSSDPDGKKTGTQQAVEETREKRMAMNQEERDKLMEIESVAISGHLQKERAMVKKTMPEVTIDKVENLIETTKKNIADLELLIKTESEKNLPDYDMFKWDIVNGEETISGNGLHGAQEHLKHQKELLAIAGNEIANRDKNANKKPSLKVTAKKAEPETEKTEAEIPETDPFVLADKEKETVKNSQDALAMAINEKVNMESKVKWLANVNPSELEGAEKEIYEAEIEDLAGTEYEIPAYKSSNEISKESKIIPDATSDLPEGSVTRVIKNEVWSNGTLISPGEYMVVPVSKKQKKESSAETVSPEVVPPVVEQTTVDNGGEISPVVSPAETVVGEATVEKQNQGSIINENAVISNSTLSGLTQIENTIGGENEMRTFDTDPRTSADFTYVNFEGEKTTDKKHYRTTGAKYRVFESKNKKQYIQVAMSGSDVFGREGGASVIFELTDNITPEMEQAIFELKSADYKQTDSNVINRDGLSKFKNDVVEILSGKKEIGTKLPAAEAVSTPSTKTSTPAQKTNTETVNTKSSKSKQNQGYKLTSSTKAQIDFENEKIIFTDNQGTEKKSSKHTISHSKKASKIPNMINVWWNNVLTPKTKKQVIEFIEDYNYEISKNAQKNGSRSLKSIIMSNILKTKFKPLKEIKENVTDVSEKKWFSEKGVKIDTFVSDYLLEELRSEGHSGYDEQDVIDLIIETVNEFPSGITKKNIEEENNRTDLTKEIEDLRINFSEKFGLDIDAVNDYYQNLGKKESLPESKQKIKGKTDIEKHNALSHANRFKTTVKKLADVFQKTGKRQYKMEVKALAQKNGETRIAVVDNSGRELQMVSYKLPKKYKDLKPGESLPVTLNYVPKNEWNRFDEAKRKDGTPYGDKIEVRDPAGKLVSNISEGLGSRKITENGRLQTKTKNPQTGSVIETETDPTLTKEEKIDIRFERMIEQAKTEKKEIARKKQEIIANIDNKRNPCSL